MYTLNDESLDKFLQEKMTVDTRIQDVQERFLEGDLDLKEASDIICGLHKRLKNVLDELKGE